MPTKRYLFLMCLLGIAVELIFRQPIVSIIIICALLSFFYYISSAYKENNSICKYICGVMVSFAPVYVVDYIINGIAQVSSIAFFFFLHLCCMVSMRLSADSDEENEYDNWSSKGIIVCAVILLLYKYIIFFVEAKYAIMCEDEIFGRLINYLIFDLSGGGIICALLYYIPSKFTPINKSAYVVLVVPFAIINTEFLLLLYVILNLIVHSF